MKKEIDIKQLQRDLKKRTKHLQQITEDVVAFIHLLDKVMQEPQSPQRGSKVAMLSNALDMSNDTARYFGVGIDYRADKKSPPKKCLFYGHLSQCLQKKGKTSLFRKDMP